MHRRCDDDRGQLLPLVALLMVAIGVAGLALGRAAGGARLAAQATTAADGAALAGAAAGEEAARRVAAANGAVVTSYESAGLDVRVGVRVEDHRASARARAGRVPEPPSGSRAAGAGTTGLTPALQAALARASDLLGRPVPVTSGFRSRADQARLYAGRAANPYPVAPPGTSMHERGLAVDVPSAFAERLAAVGPAAGLCRPYPRSDPVHFELCPRLPEKAPG